MDSKQHIVENWLPRYTGTELDQFGKYILLTNFDNYVEKFAASMGVEVRGVTRPCATPPTMASA
jgi:AMP nucleosidase